MKVIMHTSVYIKKKAISKKLGISIQREHDMSSHQRSGLQKKSLSLHRNDHIDIKVM